MGRRQACETALLRERPHFSGKSYIRDGTRTVAASENHVDILIDRRGSKTNEILKWLGKTIRVDQLQTEENVRRFGRVLNSTYPTVDYGNQFFVTLRYPENPIRIESVPLRRVEISYDGARGCLLLEVYPL